MLLMQDEKDGYHQFSQPEVNAERTTDKCF
jgi:hypothetical protein